jgi:hypothetical protein
MSFNQLRIGHRLGLAFLALVLTTMALGGVAIWELSRINANIQDIAGNWMPSIVTLDEMRVSLNRMRRSEGRMASASSPHDLEIQTQAVAAGKAALLKQEAIFAPMVTPGAETELFAKYKSLRDAYWFFAGQAA